jgi:Leucine-rich repeat (LRR) protein
VPGDALELFDLKWTQKLEFYCYDKPEEFRLALLPSQLRSVTLGNLKLLPRDLFECGTRVMPCLIDLRLEKIAFKGRLQDYLDCPKLKRLYLDQVEFSDSGTAIEDDKKTPKIPIPLSSSVSFSSIPELETLYVCNGKFDRKFADSLQSCPLLQRLSAKFCSIEDFIPSFKTAIADSKSFPSLKSLCIENSRKAEPWPQNAFARYCISQRPGLSVSSNDREFGNVL